MLQSHFGGARWENGQEVYFPSHGPSQLTVGFDKKGGRIEFVAAADELPDATRIELERRVREALLEPLAPLVSHAVLFFSRRVRTTYRAPDDSFQISPVPVGAPQPDVLYADHPFLLSYPVRPSSESSITIDRVVRGRQEWAWFLNVVLRDRVKGQSPSSEHHWVLAGRDVTPPITERVIWAQEFYALPEDTHLPSDRFPELQEPTHQVENGTYYSRFGDTEDELTVPALFGEAIASFNALDSVRRDKFIRAAQWFDAGLRMWNVHYGAGLAALVSAVETLAWAHAHGDPCPTCGKDRNPGPTARFKAFVDRYAGRQGTVRPADAYGQRSTLLHGAERHALDEPGFTAFVPEKLRGRDDWEALMRLTQAVLINWLLDPEP